MRFLAAENLNRALGRWFVSKGHEAEQIEDVLGKAARGHAIAERVAHEGAIVLSRDLDVLDRVDGGQQLSLLWLRTGNLRTRAVIARLDADWPRIDDAF